MKSITHTGMLILIPYLAYAFLALDWSITLLSFRLAINLQTLAATANLLVVNQRSSIVCATKAEPPAQRSSHITFSFSAVEAFNLLRLKSLPDVQNLINIPGIMSLVASSIITTKNSPKSSLCQNIPLLDSFCYYKWIQQSASHSLHPAHRCADDG